MTTDADWRVSQLAVLRQDGLLTDALIVAADGGSVRAHSALLAAASDYFRALFMHDHTGTQHTDTKRINASEWSRTAVQHVVDWVYGGRLQLGLAQVQQLLPLAHFWQIQPLVDHCCHRLIHYLTDDNAISMYLYARQLSLQPLHSAARDHLLLHCARLVDDVQWPQLAVEDVHSLLRDDRLATADECVVLRALANWLHDKPQPQPQNVVQSLVACCRLVFCSAALRQQIAQHPLIDSMTRSWVKDELAKLAVLCPFSVYDTTEYTRRPRIPHHVLFAVGGWTDGAPTEAVECYDQNADRWFFVPAQQSATARAYHALLAVAQRLYVIGGFDGTEYYNSTRYLELASCSWHDAAPMYVPRCYVSAAQLNGLVYAVGGFDGRQRLRSAECYDPQQNQWRLLSPMQRARSDACLAALNNKLYVTGGFNGEAVLRSVEVYHVDRDEWTMVAEMLQPRSGVSLVVAGQHDDEGEALYAVGGFDGLQRLTSVEKYTEQSGRWVARACMHTPRSNFACTELDGRVYAVGGFNGTTTVANVERYEPQLDTWTQVRDMNLNRSAVKAVVVHNCVDAHKFTFHGNAGPANTDDDNYEFD